MAGITSMQFKHDNDLNEFLAALSVIDEKRASMLREDLNKTLETGINWSTPLNDEKQADISQIMQSYNVIHAGYLKLYHDGLASAISALLSKCGSVTYTIDLFNGYIEGSGEMYCEGYCVNADFFKRCYNDSIYDDYFAAIHKGLFNIVHLRHPDYNLNYILFLNLRLLPLKQSNSVVGVRFLFDFNGDTVRYIDDYVDIGVEFKSMSKSVIVQMTQIMNKDVIYKNKLRKFVQIKNNGDTCDLDKILKNLQL